MLLLDTMTCLDMKEVSRSLMNPRAIDVLERRMKLKIKRTEIT